LDFLFAALSILGVTVVASSIYYRRITQAQGEYEDAKDIVKNITLGFTRQLNRIGRNIYRIEENTNKSQQSASEALKTSSAALEISNQSLNAVKLLTNKLGETDKKMDTISNEIDRLSKSYKIPLPQKALDAPIPIQQEDIIDQLTETELDMLIIIEEMGEGKVPEIRDRIKKTREHTARLLKKLYEKGFIDRNTSRMPYRYIIRKEIRDIIQQQKKKMKISV